MRIHSEIKKARERLKEAQEKARLAKQPTIPGLVFPKHKLCGVCFGLGRDKSQECEECKGEGVVQDDEYTAE